MTALSNLPPGLSAWSGGCDMYITCDACEAQWVVAAQQELGATWAVNEDIAFICPVCGFDGEVRLAGADLAAIRAKYVIDSDSIVERVYLEAARAFEALADQCPPDWD